MENADLRLRAGSRYAFVARNGTGKSVILRALATGMIPHVQRHIRCAYVQREAAPSDASCLEFVMKGAGELAAW